jgi:hypothetical protein
LRRKVKETRADLKKSSPIKGDSSPSPEEELKTLKPLAEPLACCPDILGEVARVLTRLGLAGQEREAKIIYLALTSRIFERPVNVAVKGPSSGGKSFLVEQCLGLFPDNAYYALSAMSEKALAYSQEPMSHRHLVIYEASGLGSDFAQYLLRSLLSEGRIRYETVDKTSEGMKSRLIEREGPTGLIVTTTRAGLHPENETRILSLEVDDSPKQTRAVLLAYAQGEKQAAVDRAPFQALQRILELERPQVVIPFAEPLARACNPTAVRLRRDFPMVLYLVKAHAALHAYHRPKDEQGRIIASLEDYQAVYDLVAALVACGTGHRVSETLRQTVEAVSTLLENGSSLFAVTVQELAQYLERDESSVNRRVNAALKAGYLINTETRQGAQLKLQLGQSLSENQTVLPQPDKIKRNPCPPESGATLQPEKDLSNISDSYGLQPPMQPPCNLQPPALRLHGCITETEPATDDATINSLILKDNQGTVAGLQRNPGSKGGNNLNLFSGEEFDL